MNHTTVLMVIFYVFIENGFYRDIVFLADASDDVDWQQVQGFSKSIVDKFDVSPKGTHFAYVVYSDDANRVAAFPQSFGPGVEYNAETVKDIIGAIQKRGGQEKNANKALPLVYETFTAPYGGRPNSRKVTVLVF